MAKKSEILPNLFWDSVPLTGKDSGVYGIINRGDGRIYIGGSINLCARMGIHKYDIRLQRHAVKKLQTDILSNPDNFEFVIIEKVEGRKTVLEREQFWLDFYQSYLPEKGYNRCRNAATVKGFRHDEEARKKFGVALRGRKRPPRSKEWAKKISTALTGRRAVHSHKPVIQLSADGAEIKKWECATDAARHFNARSSSAIVRVLKNPETQNTAYGFKWRYA